MPKKTWLQRMQPNAVPKVNVMKKPFAGVPIGGTLYISTPNEVKKFVSAIPRGTVLEQAALRKKMIQVRGKADKANDACPVCTGIFLRIVAEAAWEELANGTPLDQITPFWRVIAPDSPIGRKLTCGSAFIEEMRAREGIAPPRAASAAAPVRPRARALSRMPA